LPAAAAAGSLRAAAAVYRARHAEQPLGAYDAGGPGSRDARRRAHSLSGVTV